MAETTTKSCGLVMKDGFICCADGTEHYNADLLTLALCQYLGEKCAWCGIEYKDLETLKSKNPRRIAAKGFQMCCDECYFIRLKKLLEET